MNNDMLIGGGIRNIGGPKIDPRDYKTVKCHKCGGIIFRSGVVLKEIPGAVVGQGGEPVVVPLQVLVCDKCNEILESDVKGYKLEKDLTESTSTCNSVHIEENKGNILIS